MKKTCIISILILSIVFTSVGSIAFGSTVYSGVNNASAILANMSYTDIGKSFAKQDIMRMTALSIIRGSGNGMFYPANKLKREEALAMILRLMGKEKDVQVAQSGGASNSVPTTGASGQVDSWAQGVITTAESLGLLSKQESSLNFTQYATRQEVANWIAKGINLSPVYGKDAQYVYSYKDSKLFDSDKMPYIEATIESSVMTGYNNGYFGANDSITREQMASVLNRAFNISYAMMGYTKDEGYIEDIEKDNVDGGTRNTYILKNINGQDVALVAEKSPYENYDFAVLKNGKAGLSSVLSNGDRLTYYTNGNNVVFAQTSAGSTKTISGTIDSIWQGSFRLVDENGKSYVINYDNNTKVTMNSVEASVNDLKYGETAEVTIYGDTATNIDVEYTDLSSDGQVETGDRQDSGKIVSISYSDSDMNNALEYVTLDNGNKYTLSPAMPVKGAYGSISANSLKVGDYIKLYFSSINSNTPDELYLQDDYNKPVAVIRGSIAGMSGLGHKMQLSNVEIYRQGQWNSNSDYATYSFDGASLYLDGGKISANDINKYKGYEAYITLENHYGTETATVINIQTGFNMSYQGSIDYDGNTMSITLSDNRKVSVNDTTIILKDGLLVPKEELANAAQAYVSFARGGAANFISIIDANAPSEYYYAKGKIIGVTADSLTIGNSYYYGGNEYGDESLENNEWVINGDETFYIGDTTYIVDNSGNSPVQVSYDDFMKQKYGAANYNPVYIVVNDDNVIAVNIRPLSSSDRVSKAVVSSVSGKVITIDNDMDWNGLNDKWELNTALDFIDASKAVIVKNNKAISVNDLKSGDNLYIIRDGASGIVITVQQ